MGLPAPGRLRTTLGPAIALAVVLHALLLWAGGRADPRTLGAGGTATNLATRPTRLRLLTPPPAAPVETAPVSPEPPPVEPPRHDSQDSVATASAQQEGQLVSVGEADAPLPSYPDAPMPKSGGELRLRWWLTLDEQGQVLVAEGRKDAETDATAFAKAGRTQLPALRFTAAQLGLAQLPSRLCAELRFVEDGNQVELRRLPQADSAARCLGHGTPR